MPDVDERETSALAINPEAGVAFGELMDTLVEVEGAAQGQPAPAGDGDAAGAGEGAVPNAADAAPAAAVPVPGSPEAAAAADAPGADGDGGTPEPAAAGEPSGDDQPPAGEPAEQSPAPDLSGITGQLGELGNKFEENVTKAFQSQAYQAVKEEHGPYFDALEKHPRLLVGTEVPKVGGEPGQMETLRDAQDAKDWQEAVKSILVQEINSRAQVQMDESKDYMATVHASIELFQKNPDLVPGSKGFNRELADTFATMVKPYEVRIDGKLHGYSIPVGPILDQLRGQLAARSPSPAASPPGTAPEPQASKPAEPPQAAVQSKAGSAGGEKEDFSTLFGTIGLPNLQI